ncbi:MAG TPA: ribosome biogenesis GTP-binding protein YihA/YsxC [Stellaceae bacterium]|nr:ribosome biogenesis GTP-binding protein YihA/YsxC [Stellaceae bacterium]
MGHHASSGRGLSAAPTADVFPPREADADAVEEGRRLFTKECRFVAGAAAAAGLPRAGLPEIAFAGRSNVGKSSLVNALVGQRALARTSDTPGRTRQINFFELGGRLMLVDLPGYGYAAASKRLVEEWTSLVRHYLATRAALRRLCLLIDARHGIKEIDRPLIAMLDELAVSYQIVLTKSDKIGAEELARVAAGVTAELATRRAAHPEIHLTSALKARGIAALRASLAAFAAAG